jgi:hypothetical protein
MTTTPPPLREALENYLALRRALGFKLASHPLQREQIRELRGHRPVQTVLHRSRTTWSAAILNLLLRQHAGAPSRPRSRASPNYKEYNICMEDYAKLSLKK